MNVETLRREYEKLTPFEREALLVRESVGRCRDVEVDALGARDLFECVPGAGAFLPWPHGDCTGRYGRKEPRICACFMRKGQKGRRRKSGGILWLTSVSAFPWDGSGR